MERFEESQNKTSDRKDKSSAEKDGVSPWLKRALVIVIALFFTYILLLGWKWLFGFFGNGAVYTITSVLIFLWVLILVHYLDAKFFTKTKRLPDICEKHQGALTLMGVFLVLLLFWVERSAALTSQLNGTFNSIKDIDSAMDLELDVASATLREIPQDLNRDRFTVIWNDFAIESLRSYSDHVRRYYSETCLKQYLALLSRIEALNNLEEEKRRLLIPNNGTESAEIDTINDSMVSFSSSSIPLLNSLKNECKPVLDDVTMPFWYNLPKGLMPKR